MAMRLTEKQKEFIQITLDDIGRHDGDTKCFWECFPAERRTAISLQKKGLVEFKDGEEPVAGSHDMLMARLTKAGLEVLR